MTADTTAHTSPFAQICCEVGEDDFSVRAPHWFYFESSRLEGLLSVTRRTSHGSGGTESQVAEWSSGLDEWRTRLERQSNTKETFVPKTELGRKLWALRQKYISEGGRLYTAEEIADELDRRQRGLE